MKERKLNWLTSILLVPSEESNNVAEDVRRARANN
jgi:hypothetical protein